MKSSFRPLFFLVVLCGSLSQGEAQDAIQAMIQKSKTRVGAIRTYKEENLILENKTLEKVRLENEARLKQYRQKMAAMTYETNLKIAEKEKDFSARILEMEKKIRELDGEIQILADKAKLLPKSRPEPKTPPPPDPAPEFWDSFTEAFGCGGRKRKPPPSNMEKREKNQVIDLEDVCRNKLELTLKRKTLAADLANLKKERKAAIGKLKEQEEDALKFYLSQEKIAQQEFNLTKERSHKRIAEIEAQSAHDEEAIKKALGGLLKQEQEEYQKKAIGPCWPQYMKNLGQYKREIQLLKEAQNFDRFRRAPGKNQDVLLRHFHKRVNITRNISLEKLAHLLVKGTEEGALCPAGTVLTYKEIKMAVKTHRLDDSIEKNAFMISLTTPTFIEKCLDQGKGNGVATAETEAAHKLVRDWKAVEISLPRERVMEGRDLHEYPSVAHQLAKILPGNSPFDHEEVKEKSYKSKENLFQAMFENSKNDRDKSMAELDFIVETFLAALVENHQKDNLEKVEFDAKVRLITSMMGANGGVRKTQKEESDTYLKFKDYVENHPHFPGDTYKYKIKAMAKSALPQIGKMAAEKAVKMLTGGP